MKVFIRSSDQSGENPQVVAYYSDGSDVPADAHGAGVQVFSVPNGALKFNADSPLPKLVDDWRDRSTASKSRGQLASVQELVRYIINYGSDTAKWPSEAKKRRAEIDKLWP